MRKRILSMLLVAVLLLGLLPATALAAEEYHYVITSDMEWAADKSSTNLPHYTLSKAENNVVDGQNTQGILIDNYSSMEDVTLSYVLVDNRLITLDEFLRYTSLKEIDTSNCRNLNGRTVKIRMYKGNPQIQFVKNTGDVCGDISIQFHFLPTNDYPVVNCDLTKGTFSRYFVGKEGEESVWNVTFASIDPRYYADYLEDEAGNKYYPEDGQITLRVPAGGKTYTAHFQEYLLETPTQDDNGIYLLDSTEDMVWFADQFLTQGVKTLDVAMTADIDLTRVDWKSFDFMGTFDGRGHTLTLALGKGVSLFNRVGTESAESGEIRGLTLAGSAVTSPLVSLLRVRGTVSDCVNYASVSDGSGLVEQLVGGTIRDCMNYADLNAKSARGVGGIVGKSESGGSISGCGNYGNITGTVYAGGIVGYFWYYTNSIVNCLNTGDITGATAGGIVGSSYCPLINCYNTGDIATLSAEITSTTRGYAGGITGEQGSRYDSSSGGNIGGEIQNCYSVGSVTGVEGSILGAITGMNESGKETQAYYLSGDLPGVQKLAHLTGGGLFGDPFTIYSTDNTTAMTAQEMKAEEFLTTLGTEYFKADARNLNDGYPVLFWEDNNPPVSRTVYVSFSEDGSFLTGYDTDNTTLAVLPVTVEYFDLAEYGLEGFYRKDDSGEVIEEPTVLHLYIRLLEQYYLGGETLKVGISKRDLMDPYYALMITGGATSMYMKNFWGHDENLTYFVNHQYPLMAENWGATADWILLNDGDVIELAMYSDWSFWQNEGAGFRYFVDADGNDINSLTETSGTFTVRRSMSDAQGNRSYVNEPDAQIFYIDAARLTGTSAVSTENGWTYITTADENGEFTFDLSVLDPGEYIIGTPGNGVSAPGAVRLHISPCPGHVYSKIVVEPTCTTDGYVERTCELCGLSSRENFVPALGHNYEAVITQPTHNTMGYTIHTCPACGSSYVDSFTDALEHEFTTEITKPATCQSEGEITFTCACGESYVMILPVGDHDCEREVVEPTCKTMGYTTYTCKNCEFTFISNLVPAIECPSKGFTDVETGAWYHEAVDYAIANGLMNGTDSKTFAPNGTTTRSMMATLLYRMAGEPDVAGLENPFTDVPAEAWYNKAVIWAFNEGVVTGASATTFNPDGELTREQLAVMLWRYADKPDADETVLNGFADVKNVGSYAKADMAWAVENGLVNGVGGNALDPTGTATRAQIATILMRYTQN